MKPVFHYHYCALLFSSSAVPSYVDGMLSLNNPVVNQDDYVKAKEMIVGQGRSDEVVFLSFSQHFDFGYGGSFSMSYSLMSQKLAKSEAQLFKEVEQALPR